MKQIAALEKRIYTKSYSKSSHMIHSLEDTEEKNIKIMLIII